MNRQTFIDTLRRALYGKIDDFALADHIQYYEHYISQEIASGRSEEEVLQELGDPRLIARTILETADAKTSYVEYTVSEEEEPIPETEFQVHRYSGWKAMAITVIVILAVLLVLFLVFQAMVALLPVLIVIGIVGWVIKKIWY